MNHKKNNKNQVVLYSVTINFISLHCYLGAGRGKICFSLRQMLHNSNIFEKKKNLEIWLVDSEGFNATG